MYVNPQALIDSGIIRNVLNNSQIQPNAVDFSLDSLYEVHNLTPCYISNDKTKNIMRSRTPVELHDLRDKGHMFAALNPKAVQSQAPGWELQPGKYYDGGSDIYVEVPEGMVAYLVIRSTFNRNAVFLISGFYDSGFKGNIGFTIYNPAGHTYIEKGTMFGQIAFVTSDSAGSYAGGYNTAEGSHWSEGVKPLEAKEFIATPATITISEPVKPVAEIGLKSDVPVDLIEVVEPVEPVIIPVASATVVEVEVAPAVKAPKKLSK